jgi:hypothetical protein
MNKFTKIFILLIYPFFLFGQTKISEIDVWDYHIVDQIMIISSEYEPVFRVIDINTSKQIAGFGQIGRGPGEINRPGQFSIRKLPSNKIQIYQVEFETNIFKSFIFDFASLTATAQDDILLPKDFTGLFGEELIQDSLLVGSFDDFFYKKRHGKRSLIIHNLKSNTFNEVILYSLKSDPFDFTAELNVNSRSLVYNPYNNEVVTLTLASNIIENVKIEDIKYSINYLDSDTPIVTSIDPQVFNSDDYLDRYSQIGIVNKQYYTLQNTFENGIPKNIISLYDNNYKKTVTKILDVGYHFNVCRENKQKNTLVLYSYEGDGFYELPIKDGVIGELKPFLRD